jgi:hypothetical protein
MAADGGEARFRGWRLMDDEAPAPPAPPQTQVKQPPKLPKEIGGAKGPEPTRYGDWEYKGRCTDF